MRFGIIILAFSAISTSTSNAFVTPITRATRLISASTALNDVTTDESAEAIETESKDTTVTEVPLPDVADHVAPAISKHISPDRIEKATKPRPYPLFLAEKTASVFDFSPASAKEKPRVKAKERLVVLGTGWGAAAFLKDIDTDKYDVTVISPRNHFVFTPMLAGASVGTVEYRSITRPIREINKKARYLEAAATDIDPKTNTISCISIVCEGNSCETGEFEVNYDRLLFAVGAQTTTFGTPGVEEYCNYLKQVGDAQLIKNAIVNCFEQAGLPDISDEKKEKELTFAIVGAGPTGIEFAAELLDFIEKDGPRFYPDLLPFVRIKIIEAAPDILRPFEDGMRKEAIRRLTRTITIESLNLTIQPLEFLLNTQVSEVSEDYVYFKDGNKISYGSCLWAAGIGPLPITASIIEALEYTEQKNAQESSRGRLAVDPWLRVIGGEGKIFSLGDCSCINASPLAATAQVASQQGEFLAKLLSRDYLIDAKDEESSLLPPISIDQDQPKMLSEQIASFSMGESEIAAPFQYLDLGILAYTGSGTALAQVQVAPGDPTNETWKPVRLQITGKVGFDLWRTIYLLKQTSPKNVVLVTLDWIKTQLFGRDISIL
mmetsp:Transcript_1527/g.3278  ORF Transcript_1527/g.3278 Transcript_1527/m.3278 type:complete len:605 (+) Transcript_1527:108-1922(+)